MRVGMPGRGWWIGALSFALTSGVMVVATPPVQAQSFSEGYQFLKAVKERDGAKAKEIMDTPGSGRVVINTRESGSGEAGLHIVVKSRDLAWTSFLLSNGANPNVRDTAGNMPLLLAARVGWEEGATLLLSRGAQVNAAGSGGETPLIAAVQNRNLSMVRLLLSRGADPKIADRSTGMSARDHAERDGRSAAILKEIQEAKPVKPRGTMGPTL